MILTMDVGNTNTVLGVYNDDKRKAHWRISTDKDKTPDEYGILLQNLLSYTDINIGKINGIIISSVVPPVVTVLEETANVYFGHQPLIIGPGVKTGINIQLDNPREVGADRIVNAVAAYQKFGGPLVIVDFGTATTFCAVTGKGDYIGGAIAPGINISTEALFQYAAKLPRIELIKPDKAIGKNTVTAMQSGIINGFIGQVEYLIQKFKKELDGDSRVVATGGLVNLIAEQTKMIDVVAPFLTLEGLYYLGKINGIRE